MDNKILKNIGEFLASKRLEQSERARAINARSTYQSEADKMSREYDIIEDILYDLEQIMEQTP